MPRRLLTVRELAKLTGAPDHNIRRAIQNGTLQPATGDDVPPGKVWIEESVGLQWGIDRPRLQRQGRPRSTPP